MERTEETLEEEEELIWQWLCACPILTRHEISVLIRYFGSVREVYQAPASELSFFTKAGLKWPASLMKYKKTTSPEETAQVLKSRDILFCSRFSSRFPRKLRQIPDCPYGLFYKGRLPDPDILSVAVIGARVCSSYGAGMSEYLGRELAARGVQVISGMAAGIDGIAQRACLDAGGFSYGVLGCGADICYPPENRNLYRLLQERGGVLSEYGPGTPPVGVHFPVRNRIISGMADAVVVVEARKKSGSLITADLALDQGKDIYAVPGRFGEQLSYGCNHLIEQGAAVLISVDQMVKEVQNRVLLQKENIQSAQSGTRDTSPEKTEKNRMKPLQVRPEKNRNIKPGQTGQAGKEPAVSLHTALKLTDTEKIVYDRLECDSKGFDQILQETGLSMTDLMQTLLSLQMKNAAKEVSRNRYAKAEIR